MMALRTLASQKSILYLPWLFLSVSRVLGQTISIGTDFITSTASASSAQLTGVSCAIHVYPNGDFGLDMSNGLRDQIQNIKSSSTNGTSVETKIQNAIIAANYNIQKKQLGSAAIAEGAFILGTISYLFNSHPEVPIHVQILSEDVAQMSSAEAAFTNPNVMYIKTMSAGPVATVPLADSSPTVAPSVALSSAASCPSQIIRCETVDCGGQYPNDVCEEPGKQDCKCGPTLINPIAEPPFDANAWTAGLASWALILSSLSTMTTGQSTLPSCTLVAPGSNDGCANQHCYCPSGGGVIVPPLTSIISGTTTTDCSYTTQPSIDNCPPAPSTSTTSSTTLRTSTTAAASPTVGPVICNTYQTSYSNCWTDINANEVNTTADAMIQNQLPNGPMTSGSPNITEVITVNGLNYFMNIGWIPGCVAVDSQDPANPIASDQSIATRDILWQTYNDCPGNHGIGGYSSTVCLRIGFFPTKVNGVGGSPPTPTNYWNNPVYC